MTAPAPIWALHLIAGREAAHEAMHALESTAAPAADAVSCFDLHNGRDWRVEALYSSEPERRALPALLGKDLALRTEIELLADENWVAKSLHGLPPVVCGRLFVHGSHDAAMAPVNAIPIRIEAGLAFGTGHHGTTSGCLEALERLRRITTPRSVLDLGCGSGVLTVAAAKLWRRAQIFAADIDPEAVAVARANARLNGVSAVRTIRATGLNHAGLRAAGPYDLILANILARPLTRLAGDIARALRPGGRVVLSGLLSHQQRTVRNFYEGRGLALERRYLVAGWATLTFRKLPATRNPEEGPDVPEF